MNQSNKYNFQSIFKVDMIIFNYIYHSNKYTWWAKSHFTLLKANKRKPNRAKKIGFISNERPDLGVFLLMKNSFIV